MKTLINKLMKFALVASFAFAGAAFANASFVSDPSTQGNGVTSIASGYNDANDANSLSVSIPNNGDSEEFYVFIDYQNASSSTLEGVRARLTYSGTGTVTFTGKLTSSNGGNVSDGATLTGLPSSHEIVLISSTKVNTHGSQCGSMYEYNTSISGLTSSNGALIGSLDNVGQSATNGYTGACSQGHVVAKFKITNTEDGGGTGGDETIDVNTLAASSVTTSSATLNGDLVTGGPADHYWFVYSSSDTTPECTLVPNDPNPNASYISTGANPSYSYTQSGLNANTTYYYQACVTVDGQVYAGGVKVFETDGNNSNDDDDSVDVEIDTLPYEDIGTTFAELCGDLQNDGGDSGLRTNIEVRPANGGSWDGSPFRQQGEGDYCVTVNGLTPNTRYQYRACTDDGDCGDVRTFITNGGGQVLPLNVNTLAPTSIGATSAVLNGSYQGSSLEPTRMWFEWGRSQSLGTRKQTFSRTATAGNFNDSFNGLQSCSTYYYRAVAQNSTGIKYGNTYQLTTSCVTSTGGTTVVTQAPKVTVVEKVEEQTIDLDSLGLGLSLLRLDIDDNKDAVSRDSIVEYVVRWENISNIDLDTIDIKVVVPKEITVTGSSKGRFDADENVLFYTIDQLDREESGELTISGVVNNGSLGDVITAEATAAYNNPINDAQENATDYDVDDFVLNTNFGSASVFGLSNITFLGWLTILLGLLIIFLIARWLYLEREELRAQAYAGYRPAIGQDPRYGYDPRFLGSAPQDQAPRAVVEPRYDQGPDDSYQPYRPNRG
jgi:hypothetical protein